MRKTLILIFILPLILAIPIQASAVTPPLRIPSIKIPDISGSVKIDTKPAVDAWFEEHTVKIDWTKFDFKFDFDFKLS